MAYRSYIETADGGGGSKFPGTTPQDDPNCEISTSTHSEVLSVEYAVHAVLHKNSGNPEGIRQHEPVKVLMAVDKNSPVYYKALCTGETLPRIFITFTRKIQGKAGNEVAMRLQLWNAHVKDFKFMTGKEGQGNTNTSLGPDDPEKKGDTRELCEVTFSAQKVGLATGGPDGNVGHVDDWHKPQQSGK